jgi:CheY-like chemotaxis protein
MMDGFQATAQIREQEIGSGRHQQIVAMTAHALKGDRERCLEAGMDGYVSKPLRAAELFAAIDRVVGADAAVVMPASEPDASVGGGADDAVFDVAEALADLGEDRELLRELIGLFLAQAPTLLSELRAAAGRGDGEGLQRAAHELRGSMANLEADLASQAALRLETMGRNGDLAAAEEALADLDREVARLQEAVAGFVAESTAGAASPRDG